MQIVNLGSLNLDHVYGVQHFASAGETVMATSYASFAGGKGLNQSVALARAGASVYHVGAIGKDGEALKQVLEDAGASLQYLQVTNGPSGTAIIQLNPKGQNCIIVHGGANTQIEEKYIDKVLSFFSKGDLLLTQNETNIAAYAIEKAHELGLKVAFNPSPITPDIFDFPLHMVDYFLLNEIEGRALAGVESENFEIILNALHAKYPKSCVVLTAGANGVYYKDETQSLKHGIYPVKVVDTTAAGDTFCGFFIASIAKGFLPSKALHYASCASSMAVAQKGAAPSIPTWAQLAKNPNFERPLT